MKLSKFLTGQLVIANSSDKTAKAFFIQDSIEENGSWFYTDGNRWFNESTLTGI